VRNFLAAVIIAQLAFLLASFGILIFQRWHGRRRATRRSREREEFERFLDRTCAGELTGGALGRVIDRCDPETVTLVLQERVPNGGDAEWEAVVPHVRKTRWFEGVVTHHTRSRLWWRRLVGARTLALVGEESDLPVVRRLVDDRHPAVRLAAISIIKRIPDAGAIAAVLDQAVKSRRVVRHYAFDTLAVVGEPVLPVLRQHLRDAKSPFELGDLIRLAGALRPPDLIEIIQRYVGHEDAAVRSACARALGASGDTAALPLLEALLGDGSWRVRTRAASALGKTGSRSAAEWLSRALADGDWWVRLRAAIALRQIGASGVEYLEVAAAGDDSYAAEMARYTLGLTEAAVKDYSA
jgi:hypothetical protein